MIYLIGGPARDGKTTLARKFRKEIDGTLLMADALTKSLRAVLDPSWMPDLFAATNGYHPRSPIIAETLLEHVRRRDKAMWVFFEKYLQAASKDSHDDILLEGGIWPDLIGSLELEHRAAFLIDTSPVQSNRIMEIRDSIGSDNNWMSERGYSDAEIKEWAVFNALRGRLYRDLCLEHNYAYFDIAEGGIGKAESRAFEHLLQEKV